jgi:hypothetical protein
VKRKMTMDVLVLVGNNSAWCGFGGKNGATSYFWREP